MRAANRGCDLASQAPPAGRLRSRRTTVGHPVLSRARPVRGIRPDGDDFRAATVRDRAVLPATRRVVVQPTHCSDISLNLRSSALAPFARAGRLTECRRPRRPLTITCTDGCGAGAGPRGEGQGPRSGDRQASSTTEPPLSGNRRCVVFRCQDDRGIWRTRTWAWCQAGVHVVGPDVARKRVYTDGDDRPWLLDPVLIWKVLDGESPKNPCGRLPTLVMVSIEERHEPQTPGRRLLRRRCPSVGGDRLARIAATTPASSHARPSQLDVTERGHIELRCRSRARRTPPQTIQGAGRRSARGCAKHRHGGTVAREARQ